jgi:hypothetical protein
MQQLQEKGVISHSLQKQASLKKMGTNIRSAKDDQDALLTQIPNDPNSNQQWSFKPQTLAEFFFADATGEMPKDLDLKEVDLIYNDYIRVMTCTHEKLRALYNSYVTKFIDDK